jgi:GDPmannose 4,6-dehydratase
MGNIEALRDWGHAQDYVRMQWLMLQLDKPEDFVIATGVQYTVRQFIEWTSQALGKAIRWEGSGVDTVGYWGDQPVVKIDPRYFRPTEVETLLGDPAKAKALLGWVPEITAQQMCAEMVETDLAQATKHALLIKHGYSVNVSLE